MHRDTDEGIILQLDMNRYFVHCKSSCIAGNLFDPISHHLSISENGTCWKITKKNLRERMKMRDCYIPDS